MKKTTILILMCLMIFSCKEKTKKETYFQAQNGKIFTLKEYEDIKIKMSERGELQEDILSVVERNDSIIKIFKTTVKETVNPFSNMEPFIGEKLPFSELTSIDGEKVNLSTLNGKPTLINLWFINCPPCIEEMPNLNKLKEKYAENVNFVAITFESKEKVVDFLVKKSFNYTHFVSAKNEIDKLNNQAYPLNIYLDKNGIITSFTGMIATDNSNEMIDMELEKLL
ncbi:TlpA family protein disulfide reductase [Psychroserpens luteus]|uniref:TlpA family protein disulfide reductase n=1 Tax=Psychroserpens luteus TaxID=1434066 RepID=A0ABW5ZR47_9FLAO|nr:TlpA disulfide reductase family protein [Psychroserpens luteus]